MEHKIYLIDAYAHIYRGFHAIQNLSTKDGRPSNAIFAFARFLISLEKEYSPDLGAVVFDVWPPTARLLLHPGYKANRPLMPDDMRVQITAIRNLIESTGWKIIEKNGFEADDILAALAGRFDKEKIFIISNDKDLSQLVNDNVNLLVTSPGVKGFQLRNTEKIMEKFGVLPEQIVDYLSLMGDNSDNIDGIDGIGPKTAAKLIQEFFSLENILNDLDKISNEKLRIKLKDNVGRLRINRQIITLDKNVPLERVKNLSDLRINLPDIGAIEALCKEYELVSLIGEFSKIYEKKSNPTLF